jgi:hypothetical protein
MPIPLDPRRKPASVKVHVKSGAGVDIDWADGHASHYDFPYLRDHCPCATCNDEREKKEDFATAIAGSTAAPAALPMFKPNARQTFHAHATGVVFRHRQGRQFFAPAIAFGRAVHHRIAS